jgi:hypothetical protein
MNGLVRIENFPTDTTFHPWLFSLDYTFNTVTLVTFWVFLKEKYRTYKLEVIFPFSLITNHYGWHME